MRFLRLGNRHLSCTFSLMMIYFLSGLVCARFECDSLINLAYEFKRGRLCTLFEDC
jgi:hypothetical protein